MAFHKPKYVKHFGLFFQLTYAVSLAAGLCPDVETTDEYAKVARYTKPKIQNKQKTYFEIFP